MSSQDLLSFDERVPFQPPPLTERISMNLRIRAMNLIVKAGPLRSTARRNSFDTIAPTQFLIYPSQPSLRHRVFFPSASSTDEKPPLFIDIHGGGFFQGDPSLDDNLNALIARQLGCIVIALDYSKAPAAKFPTARNELVAVISQILDAGNVSFDKNRVVIGGYSVCPSRCSMRVSVLTRYEGWSQPRTLSRPVTKTPKKDTRRCIILPHDRVSHQPLDQSRKSPVSDT